jgi:hypothetical protein
MPMVLGRELLGSNPKENGPEKPVLFGAADLRGDLARDYERKGSARREWGGNHSLQGFLGD